MTQRSFELPVLGQRRAGGPRGGRRRIHADVARTEWHDDALWFVREKRDRAAGVGARVGGAARACLGDQGARAHSPRRVPRAVRGQRAAKRDAGALGARRGRAQSHRARDSRARRSSAAREEQVDAHRGVRSQSVSRVARDRGGGHAISASGSCSSAARGRATSCCRPSISRRKRSATPSTSTSAHPPGCPIPIALARAAREHLREKFLAADATLTGMNFAVAETGGFVVCTNEGNADLGMALAPVHIASVGIEKVIPRAEDLPVFLRLLARSATGQAVTVYTSHVHGPREGQELHVVLVDNGRTRQLAREEFWGSLKCIRCGACMNTCPIYRRSGGHSYGSTVPGPSARCSRPASTSSGTRRSRSRPRCAARARRCARSRSTSTVSCSAGGSASPRPDTSSATKKYAIKASVGLFDHPRLFRVHGRARAAGLAHHAGADGAVRGGSRGDARARRRPPRRRAFAHGTDAIGRSER